MEFDMKDQVVYLRNGNEPDTAITNSISSRGYEIRTVYTVPEAIGLLFNDSAGEAHVVAEVAAGGVSLLQALRASHLNHVHVMMYDREGNDLNSAKQALQLGVREYLLGNDTEEKRAMRTERWLDLLQDRANAIQADVELEYGSEVIKTNEDGVVWNSAANEIVVDDTTIHLTPIQARIFDRMWNNRGQTVSLEELIQVVLLRTNMDVHEGSRLLRPHLVRLRATLDQQPKLARRIINIRGNGYTMV
jgi:DNA-binding response OmpR family regulator